MIDTKSNQTEMWKEISHMLSVHDVGVVDPYQLTGLENLMLNDLTDMIVSTYCNSASAFEYAVNQAIATHWITPCDSDTSIQFNICPQDTAIDISFDGRINTAQRWTQLLEITDGVLCCRNLKLKFHIRLDALNRVFHVSDKVAKQLKNLFGTAYHGSDIITLNEVTLATKSSVYHDVSEVCKLLKEATLSYIKCASWTDEYLLKYVTAIDAVSKQTAIK